MDPKKILISFGTRPEAIKMCHRCIKDNGKGRVYAPGPRMGSREPVDYDNSPPAGKSWWADAQHVPGHPPDYRWVPGC